MLFLFLINYSFSSNLFFQWRITDQEKAQLERESFELFKSNYDLFKKLITNYNTLEQRDKYLSSLKKGEESEDDVILYLSRYSQCQKCMNFVISLRQLRDKYGFPALYKNLQSLACGFLLSSKIEKEACQGYIRNYGYVILENFFSRYINTYDLCEKLDLCATEIPKKIIDVEDYAKKILKGKEDIEIKPKPEIKGTKTLRMLQITDVHLDLEYKEGAKTDCLYPICCRNMPQSGESVDKSKLAGKYGYEGKCDIGIELVKSFVDDAINRNVDFIIWTGDNPPHDSWSNVGQDTVYNSTKAIKELINSRFRTENKTIPVFICLGNHERFPNDIYFDDEKEILESLADIYKDYLSNDAYEEFKKYGYYNMKYSENSNLRIISLNCLVCDSFNFNLLNSTKAHTKQMFKWLEEQLQNAEKNNEVVYILNHFPLHADFLLTECAKRLHALFDRYQYIIRGIFSGHTHLDDIELISEYYNKDKIININYIAPQFTTYTYKLPSYRIYTIDDETKQVIDYEQYRFDFSKNNGENPPTWDLAYNATSSFEVNNMAEYEKLSKFNKMEDYVYHRYSDSKMGKEYKTKSEQIKNAKCAMTTHNFNDYLDCAKPNTKTFSFKLVAIFTNYFIGPFEE